MGECVTGPGGIGSDATSQQRALRKLRGRVERVEEFESRIVGGSTSSTLGMLRLFDCHLSRLAGSSFWENQPSPVGRGCPDASGRVRGHVTRQSSRSVSRAPQPEMFSSSPAILSITIRGSVGRAAGRALVTVILGLLRLFNCLLSRLAGSSFWQSQHSPVGRGPQPALSPAGAGGGPRAPGVRGHITLERCGHEKPRTFQTGPRYPSCHPEEPQARKDLRISRPRVQRISHFLSKHTVFAPIIAQPLHYRTNSLLGCRPFCHPHLCFHAHSRVDLHF